MVPTSEDTTAKLANLSATLPAEWNSGSWLIGNSTNTSIVAPSVVEFNYSYYELSAYLVLGTAICLGNALIVAIIGVNRNLQKKEFVVPLGLAIADFLHGVANLGAGIRRLALVETGRAAVRFTKWECMQTGFPVFFVLGAQTMMVMMNLLSIDRLIAMANVSLYMKINIRHVAYAVVAGFGYGVVSTTAAVLSSYFSIRKRVYAASCPVNFAVGGWYANFHYSSLAFFGISSATIYAVAICMMARSTRQVVHDKLRKEYHKRQVKVTRLLLLIIVCTVCLYDFPLVAASVLIVGKLPMHEPIVTIGTAMWLLGVSNSATNIVIYLVKNKDMRDGMRKLFGCGSTPVVSTSVDTKNSQRAIGTHSNMVSVPPASAKVGE